MWKRGRFCDKRKQRAAPFRPGGREAAREESAKKRNHKKREKRCPCAGAFADGEAQEDGTLTIDVYLQQLTVNENGAHYVVSGTLETVDVPGATDVEIKSQVKYTINDLAGPAVSAFGAGVTVHIVSNSVSNDSVINTVSVGGYAGDKYSIYAADGATVVVEGSVQSENNKTVYAGSGAEIEVKGTLGLQVYEETNGKYAPVGNLTAAIAAGGTVKVGEDIVSESQAG